MSSMGDERSTRRIESMHYKEQRARRVREKVGAEIGTYLPYLVEDKGIVNTIAEPGRPCNPNHLHNIIYNLEEILEAYVAGHVTGEGFRVKRTTGFDNAVSTTTTEIDRLMENTGLFPTAAIRERFYDELTNIASRLQKAVRILESFRKDQEDLLEVRADAYERDRLPLRNEHLKPWQQFLCKDAPGVNLAPELKDPLGATQIVPMPGTRILLDMINHATAVYRDINKEHGKGDGFETTFDNFKPEIIFPSLSRESIPYQNAIMPTLAGPASHPVRGRKIQSLEVLAQDFVHLDGRLDFGNAVGHAHPHRWNVVCLSVRDRPKPELEEISP